MKKLVVFSLVLLVGLTSNVFAAYDLVDGFEDQDYSEYTGDTGEFGFSSSFVTEGSYSMSWYDSGSGAHAMTSSSGLNAYPAQGDNYTFDFRFENNTAGGGRIVPEIGRAGGDGEHFYVRYDIGEQQILVGETETGDSANSPVTFNEDQWYKAKLWWQNDDTLTAYAYFENGTLMAQESISATDITGTDIGWVASAVNGDTYGYVDNVQAGSDTDNDAPTVSNEDPSDGATEINDTVDASPVDVNLSLKVNDNDNSNLDVYFFDGNDNLIGSQTGVSNDTRAEVVWQNLSDGTSYSWYVKVSDGITNTTSSIYSFTTETASIGSSSGDPALQSDNDLIRAYLNDTSSDSTIIDWSGSGNDLTDQGAVTFQRQGVSRAEGDWDTGLGLGFDSSSSSTAEFPNLGLFDGSKDYTVTAFFEPDDLNDQYLMSFYAESDTHLRINPDGQDRLKWQWYDGINEVNIQTSSLTAGTKYFVGIRWDASSNSREMFFSKFSDDNTTLVASDNPSDPASGSNVNQLGSRATDDQRVFNGMIDQFYVYNKTLTEQEIQNVFDYAQTSEPTDPSYSINIDSPGDGSSFETSDFILEASANADSNFTYSINGSQNKTLGTNTGTVSKTLKKKDDTYSITVYGVDSSNSSKVDSETVSVTVDAFYQSRFEDGYGENISQYMLGLQRNHTKVLSDSDDSNAPRGPSFFTVAYHPWKDKYYGLTHAKDSDENAFTYWESSDGKSWSNVGLFSHSSLETYNCLNANFHEPTLRFHEGSLVNVFATQDESDGTNSEICMIQNNISDSSNSFTTDSDWIGNPSNPVITQLPTGNNDAGDPEFYEYTDGTWRIQGQNFAPDTTGEAWQWKSTGTDPMTSYSTVNNGNPIIDITDSKFASEDSMHPWSVFVNNYTGELFTISAYVDESKGVKYHEYGFPILGDNVDSEWTEEYVDYRMVSNFQIPLSGSTNEFAREFDHVCEGSQFSRTCDVYYTAGHWSDGSTLNVSVARTSFYENVLMVENRFQNNDTGSWSYTSGNKTSSSTGEVEANIYGSNVSLEWRNGSTESDVVSSSFESLSDGDTVDLSNYYQYRVSSESGSSGFHSLEFTSLEDNTPPSISIDSPTNQSYSSSTIDLNVTSSETATFRYNVDGLSNITVSDTGTDLNKTISGLSDGGHTVNVFATDSAGNTGSASTSFTVDTNSAPAAAVTKNVSNPKTLEVIEFDASGSADTDGSISSYTWDLNDDGSFGDATGLTAQKSYSDNTLSGSVEDVSVKVTDNDGLTDTNSITFSVDNRQPSASFTTSTSNLTVDVDASGSSDQDGSISSYEYDWTNDGTFDATGQTASKTYNFAGSYNVKLRVTDDDGATSTSLSTVDVSDGTTGGGGGDTDSGPTKVAFTLDNVGSSAWVVENDSTNVADDSENPDINLEQGKRYTIRNNGYGTYGTHPLAFFDADGNTLLSQSGTGSFEDDSDVNWVDNGDTISFTVTQSLYNELSGYRCTVHGAMEGSIVQESSGGTGGGGGGGGSTSDDDSTLSATNSGNQTNSTGLFGNGVGENLPVGSNAGIGLLVILALLALPAYKLIQ